MEREREKMWSEGQTPGDHEGRKLRGTKTKEEVQSEIEAEPERRRCQDAKERKYFKVKKLNS